MSDYRFEHFRRDDLLDGRTFDAGRDPGWPMPDFDLPTLAGGHVRKADFLGNRPVLLTFASVTDPMAASAAPVLKRLHRRYGDRVAFLTVYVREAHPGDHIRQPRTMEWKLRHARMLRDRDGLPWTIAIDDLEGTLHRSLGASANAAHLMDPNGIVAFRAPWSNDERVLGQALEAIATGRSDHPFERARRVVPIARGLARVDDVVRAAGPAALDDLRRETPLLFAAAEVAWIWRALTPLGRAAGAASSAAVALAAWGGIRWLTRPPATRRARGTWRRARASGW